MNEPTRAASTSFGGTTSAIPATSDGCRTTRCYERWTPIVIDPTYPDPLRASLSVERLPPLR